MLNVVEFIEDANYWVAQENGQSEVGVYTAGKEYAITAIEGEVVNIAGKVIRDVEYYVKDDNGELQTPYQIHKGVFINH